MAIRPGNVLSGRRAERVEEIRLAEKDEGPFGDGAPIGVSFGLDHLPVGARHVHRPRAIAFLGEPGNRAIECPVELEHAHSVSEPFEAPPIPVREPIAGQMHELSRVEGEEDGAGVFRCHHPVPPGAADRELISQAQEQP